MDKVLVIAFTKPILCSLFNGIFSMLAIDLCVLLEYIIGRLD